VLNSIAEDDTADTAESVDANLCRSHVCDSRVVVSEMRGFGLLRFGHRDSFNRA
jgi:hypothetical protein